MSGTPRHTARREHADHTRRATRAAEEAPGLIGHAYLNLCRRGIAELAAVELGLVVFLASAKSAFAYGAAARRRFTG